MPRCSSIMMGGADPAVSLPTIGRPTLIYWPLLTVAARCCPSQAVETDEVFRELAANELLKYFAFRSAQLALRRPMGRVVLTQKGVLRPRACAALRDAVDAHASGAPEPADGLPLEQVHAAALTVMNRRTPLSEPSRPM